VDVVVLVVLALVTVVGLPLDDAPGPLFVQAPVVVVGAPVLTAGMPEPVCVGVIAGTVATQAVVAAPLLVQLDGWLTVGPVFDVEFTGLPLAPAV
jgi:hypothetical protein